MFNRLWSKSGCFRLLVPAITIVPALVLPSACGRKVRDGEQVSRQANFQTVKAIAAPKTSNPWHDQAGASPAATEQTHKSTLLEHQRTRMAITTQAAIPRSILPEIRPTAPSATLRPQPKNLVVPLVAMGFNPALKLSAQQIEQFAKLGQEFLAATNDEDVAAGSADPTSPVAKAGFDARWRSAQQKSDDQFKLLFGYAAFNSQQILRAQQEYQDRQAGK